MGCLLSGYGYTIQRLEGEYNRQNPALRGEKIGFMLETRLQIEQEGNLKLRGSHA